VDRANNAMRDRKLTPTANRNALRLQAIQDRPNGADRRAALIGKLPHGSSAASAKD
jgi:hypothetical protein